MILVNLVDIKVCNGVVVDGLWVFGWDVVGIVDVVGSEVCLF